MRQSPRADRLPGLHCGRLDARADAKERVIPTEGRAVHEMFFLIAAE